MKAPSLKRAAMIGLAATTLVGASLGVASAQTVQQDGKPVIYQNQPQPKPGRGDDGQRPQISDEQRQEMQQRREAQEQHYVDLLAGHLGVSSDTLKAALKATQDDLRAERINEINKAVADGKLTQEQANQMIERIQNGGPGGPGFGFGGPRMGGPGMGGPEGPGGPGRGPGSPGRGPGGPGNNQQP